MKIKIKIIIDENTGLWSLKTTSKDPFWATGNTITHVLNLVETGVKWEMKKKNLLTENSSGDITWKDFRRKK